MENSMGHDMLADMMCEEYGREMQREAEANHHTSNKLWKNKIGLSIPIRLMTNEHIKNCLRAFANGTIHDEYLGGRKAWEKIFHAELDRRFLNEVANKLNIKR